MRNVYLDIEDTLSSASERHAGVHMTPAHVMLLNNLLTLKGTRLILVGKQAQKISTPSWALSKLGNRVPVRTKRVPMRIWTAYNPKTGYSRTDFKTCFEAVMYDVKYYSSKPKWVYLSADIGPLSTPMREFIWVDPNTGLTDKHIGEALHALS